MKIARPLLLTCCLLGAALSAQAQTLYTEGHGDLGISYTPGETTLEALWGIDAGATVDGSVLTSHTTYLPNELAAFTTATTTTPSSSLTWLGVAGGSEAYRLGSNTYPPNLGFNTSGAGPDSDWQDSTMLITLSGWSGPGEVALRSGSSSGALTWFSTFDESATVNRDNTWEFDMGVGHVHLVWYFSEPGYYELTYDWAGTYIGGESPLDVTGTGTYGFYVGVVPEPASGALLGGCLALAAVLRRHRAGRA